MTYEDWILAGKITGKAINYGKELIKPGENIKEILNKIDEFIIKEGAKPAFPSQISINDTAAHYCSDINDNTIIQENDIIKLDLGASINGAIGDSAITINPNKEFKKLMNASKKALQNTIKILQIGTTLSEIGKTIEETITSEEFNPIRNLGGHGLGLFNIHSEPHIPNYNNKDNTELKKGQIIAIEPFATTGIGYVKEQGDATIFSLIQKKPVRLPLIRETLNFISQNYNHLPFAKRWLTKKFTIPKINYALKKLKEENIITQYPPLIERSNGLVSQHEHSFLIDDKVTILTKRDTE